MKKDLPTILHHKYSMEDGHVTPQIRNVKGYRGVLVTRSKGEERANSPFASVLTLKAIKKNPLLLKKHRVAGIHIHHGKLASRFRFLKEQHGLPMFVGFRGNDATAFPKKSKENLLELQKLFQLADRFFPVCEHLKREIVRIGCPEEKIRVLYGGVDLSRFAFKPRTVKAHKKIRILAVGRFVEKKGFDDLIRAFAVVRKSNPRVRLTLIGQGPCKSAYRKLIKKLGLKDSVKMIPWVDYQGIHKKYYQSHIFCAPSCTDAEGNQEGIPNTLKEAMATGMPVVSTYHAGIPELIDHRTSGLLVAERSVPELAKALNELIAHPERWRSLGEQARKKIEKKFNLKTQLKKQAEFYDEVIKGKK